MAWDVHLTIVFEVTKERKLQDLAEEYLSNFPLKPDLQEERDARSFLSATCDGRSINCGWKGAVCAWGYVGNYSNGESLAALLLPFLADAYRQKIIYITNNVAIFWEEEQSGCASVVVIEAEFDALHGATGARVGATHVLPFCWGTV